MSQVPTRPASARGSPRPRSPARCPARCGATSTSRSTAGSVEPLQPLSVDVERERGVTITWEDGRVSRFGLEELRVNCLCAQCRGLRDQGQEAWPGAGAPATLRIESVREVGNWGLNFGWNDGHTTGIYTWEILRGWNEEGSA